MRPHKIKPRGGAGGFFGRREEVARRLRRVPPSTHPPRPLAPNPRLPPTDYLVARRWTLPNVRPTRRQKHKLRKAIIRRETAIGWICTLALGVPESFAMSLGGDA